MITGEDIRFMRDGAQVYLAHIGRHGDWQTTFGVVEFSADIKRVAMSNGDHPWMAVSYNCGLVLDRAFYRTLAEAKAHVRHVFDMVENFQEEA